MNFSINPIFGPSSRCKDSLEPYATATAPANMICSDSNVCYSRTKYIIETNPNCLQTFNMQKKGPAADICAHTFFLGGGGGLERERENSEPHFGCAFAVLHIEQG